MNAKWTQGKESTKYKMYNVHFDNIILSIFNLSQQHIRKMKLTDYFGKWIIKSLVASYIIV